MVGEESSLTSAHTPSQREAKLFSKPGIDAGFCRLLLNLAFKQRAGRSSSGRNREKRRFMSLAANKRASGLRRTAMLRGGANYDACSGANAFHGAASGKFGRRRNRLPDGLVVVMMR